ncbi:MAG: hypothetical protein H0V84_05320 [Actinobacteria bacterium]|nr:hypothetical protein [Actinomycetota bacterium]
MTENERGVRQDAPPQHELWPITLAALDDAIARTIAIREAIEDGAYGYAARVAEDLEHDLAGNLHQLRDAA